jgi:rSAM/selenodomain-associated transferase 1
MPTHVNALAVMAKVPVSGTVKTRLVPPLSDEQAAELYRALVLDQLEHLAQLNSADLYLAFTPADAASSMASLMPARFQCFPQRGDDLGERMNQVFIELRRRAHRNLVVIGSDLPPVPLDFFEDAFRILAAENKRVVLGPSRDGGYYLVGMNEPTPQIFKEMTWSHAHVLAQTTKKLTRLGIDFRLLPTWFDLDTVEDLDRFQEIASPVVRQAMSRTLGLLQRLSGRDRCP